MIECNNSRSEYLYHTPLDQNQPGKRLGTNIVVYSILEIEDYS